jgi:hypothetical protein
MLLTVPYLTNKFGRFSPRALPSLVAWYDASNGAFSDAGITPSTNGADVQQWNDLSGNGYHVSYAGDAPVLGTTLGVNALQGVVFDGDDLLRSSSNAVTVTATAATIWAVYLWSTAAVNNNSVVACLVDTGGGFRDDNSINFTDDANVNRMSLYHGSGNEAIHSQPVSGSYRMGVEVSGINLGIYTNGSLTTSSTCDNAMAMGPTAGIAMGLTSSQGLLFGSTGKLIGAVSEIVITASSLSASQISELDEYFVAKWGF